MQFAAAVAQVLLISVCELLKPWPLKLVVDNVVGHEPLALPGFSGLDPRTLLMVACGGLVVLYAALAALSVVNNATTITIGQRMVNDLRLDLYQHLQRLSMRFHSTREVGDLLYRVIADTFAIQTLSMNGVFPIITSAAMFLGMMGVMLRMDWQLTLLALAVCPFIFVGISFMGRRITEVATDARQKESRLYSVTQRGISAIRVIQAFTTEEEEARRFATSSSESLRANLRLYVLQTVYSSLINVVVAVGTALVLWVGVSHVLAGTLSVGQVLVFTTYLASLYAPINSVSQTIGMVQGAAAGARRVLEILETTPDLPDGRRAVDGAALRGEVRFEHVDFAYVAGRPVLLDVDLTAQAGQVLAIVGPTGVGKSTLVSLVARFYDPVAGRVLLDGVDLREFRLRELRSRIAMVLQPAFVFPTSVRENIAYGRPFASEAEIARAAHLAQLDGFLARLPEGLATQIGEQGATVSEGERQRITIARAILRDAPILILDEPTSALDAETEALIIAALRELMRGRTTFVIAHRLSTIRHADQIVVLRDGTVAETGRFDELVERGGAFTRLYEAQFGKPVKRGAAG
ncbi:MAG TPA: ABC transporter ATP-binding protein [Candidatus Binatia bacterium]|jgi:ATP-binding cassette subfamily B protein/subfamily B ATP-binding cassette protein MsbA